MKRKAPITRQDSIKRIKITGPQLIRQFHVLQNALKHASATDDTAQKEEVEGKIQNLGGIAAYQAASIKGQDTKRGGDSSKILVHWIKETNTPTPSDKKPTTRNRIVTKVLEIGSLSVDNIISKSGLFEVSRIDLRSNHKLILAQNFLDRPEPTSEQDLFDGVSCSLVLNFVPVAERGPFLLHLCKFLPFSREQRASPWLFLVLPAPCVKNSRYFDQDVLTQIMRVLGFTEIKRKITDRIAYWLFQRTGEITPGQLFKKKERHAGSSRNNFFIPLST